MYEPLTCLFAPLENLSEFGALQDALSRPGPRWPAGWMTRKNCTLTVAVARKLGRPLFVRHL